MPNQWTVSGIVAWFVTTQMGKPSDNRCTNVPAEVEVGEEAVEAQPLRQPRGAKVLDVAFHQLQLQQRSVHLANEKCYVIYLHVFPPEILPFYWSTVTPNRATDRTKLLCVWSSIPQKIPLFLQRDYTRPHCLHSRSLNLGSAPVSTKGSNFLGMWFCICRFYFGAKIAMVSLGPQVLEVKTKVFPNADHF